MLKNFIFLLCVLGLAACGTSESTSKKANVSGLNIITSFDETLNFERLRLYPIEANGDFLINNEGLSNWSTIEQALKSSRFRITEKKPFGRFDDRDAVNNLLIHNKTQDTVFIMAGDVVKGGNQDRMIAQNMVVPPNSLQHINVFCVERNRWTARAEDSGNNPSEMVAFNGYFNVASSDLRRTMQATNNQEDIWEKVNEITTRHEATSNTGTYGALATSETFNKLSTTYIEFFQEKMASRANVVGILAVSGDKILGVDLFGHPALFQAKYPSLLHSYITEAITNGSEVTIQEDQLKAYTKNFLSIYAAQDTINRFNFKHRMVHFTDL